MTEYALVINGEYQETRSFDDKPQDIPHKGVRWLPIEERVPEYDATTDKLEATKVVEGDKLVTVYEVTKYTQEEINEREARLRLIQRRNPENLAARLDALEKAFAELKK